MTLRVTMLGCGSSAGVPFIGCDCPVCTSKDPKNNRTRVSLWIEINGKNLLIDSSPDLRQQALREGMTNLDAVLYTHDHADHTHGLDDLRSFNYLSGGPLPIYGDAKTLEMLQKRFSYAFQAKPENLWYRPCLMPHTVVDKDVGSFPLFDTEIGFFRLGHGKSKTYGYRIGNFAYSTDCDAIDDASFDALSGLDVWIVDCLRPEPSYSHAHLELTLSWIARAKPKRAILTHMSHDFDYDTLKASLPAGVEPGYDGLTINL
ncbi:MAG: MBL fold metallo-hydrolase [Alphaproteobacteria bacterium]|nr:MBL fold metallo-hydrolase [Alphaproteobacteria bacterium]